MICTKCIEDKPDEAFEWRLQPNDTKIRRLQCHECRKAEKREYQQRNKEAISIKNKAEYELIKDTPEFKELCKQRYLKRKESGALDAYVEDNRDKVLEWKRASYHRNKEGILARQKAKRDADPEGFRSKKRARRAHDRVRRAEKERIYANNRRKNDVQFRLRGNLHTRINQAVRNKSESTMDLIGCSITEFMAHIESKFTSEMSWSNYGSYWHIDHEQPCCSFDLTNPIQQRLCFNWNNCRPLYKLDNLLKIVEDKKLSIRGIKS